MGIAMAVLMASWVSVVAAQTQTSAPKAGPEYDVLNAWTGDWVMSCESRNTPTGSPYLSDWTFTGRRILNGFFLEVRHREKMPDTTREWLEVIGYDPQKKACFAHYAYDDGISDDSVLTRVDERTYVENGNAHFPGGRTLQWKFTWSFSADGKSLSVKCEFETDGKWWTSGECKGVKTSDKQLPHSE